VNISPSSWLDKFGKALAQGNITAATELFEPGGYWRDLVSFTWNIKTCEGRGEVKAMLAARLAETKPAAWKVRGQPVSTNGVTESWFTFETVVGRGFGHVRLRGKHCWTLLTTLQELKGFEEKAGAQRESGVLHGKNWLEMREQESAELGLLRQPYVVIVGGGQGGIALAARLKRLKVPALIVEKNEHAGDSWRKRYKSLCLHDPVWYDHMPYLPFPDHWPVFSPKDKLGDWLEMYAKVMELDYWGSSKCMAARYMEETGDWEVIVNRGGNPYTLRPKHLVLATGMSGFPNVPVIAGAESFAGRIVHSHQYDGGAGWAGRQCVVVGSGTSAHDICADLVEQGAAEVTMIQRAPTIVARSETLMDLAWGPLYSEQAVARGITTEIADLTVASVPFKVLPEQQRPVYAEMRKRDAEMYIGLEKAGFQYTFGEDGSGIHALYLRRGAGYYIETGASKMIIDGKIKVKSGVSVQRINEKSLTLSGGAELPADLIVLATGYGSMNQWAKELISSVVADRVGKCWGLGSDTKDDPGPWVGELRNMWKPTQQPNLWFHGGNLMQSRHYSLYLALQLKARMEGIPTPVYYVEPVHHLQ
jgi:putative flavoprotein involved in K+ transport